MSGPGTPPVAELFAEVVGQDAAVATLRASARHLSLIHI